MGIIKYKRAKNDNDEIVKNVSRKLVYYGIIIYFCT